MSETKKIGWMVSESIGVSVVNPKVVMKAIPRFTFGNEQGEIDIRQYSITITGSHEAAAKAFAEAILSRGTGSQNSEWSYCGVGIVSPIDWDAFKKNVERICNGLKAFL